MHPILKHFIAICIVTLTFVGVRYIVTKTNIAHVQAPRAQEVEAWASKIDTEVLTNLEQLELVQLDTTVVETDAYRSLKDLRVKLDTPILKRKNPFALPEEKNKIRYPADIE